MKCPECETELDSAHVLSECYQVATLKGSITDDYGEISVLETIGIECPYCNADLSELIKEGDLE